MSALLIGSPVPGTGITYWFYLRETMAAKGAAVQVAQREAAEHRLKLLESQLEPHMLFNTLPNLRGLIGVDPDVRAARDGSTLVFTVGDAGLAPFDGGRRHDPLRPAESGRAPAHALWQRGHALAGACGRPRWVQITLRRHSDKLVASRLYAHPFKAL